MTIEDFEALARERFDHCLNLMCGEKHKEYSRNGDKLHNFKQAAMIDKESPEKALWGMWKKHLVSIMDIIEDIENYQELPSEETVNEKIGDAICYLVLLEALITERILSVRLKDSPKLKKQDLP